jgi:hypothetical protein
MVRPLAVSQFSGQIPAREIIGLRKKAGKYMQKLAHTGGEIGIFNVIETIAELGSYRV